MSSEKPPDQAVTLQQASAAGKDWVQIVGKRRSEAGDRLDDVPVLLDEGFLHDERAGDAAEGRFIGRVRKQHIFRHSRFGVGHAP